MTQYYFVGTSLPPLNLESPPEISQEDLLALLEDNLTNEDLKKTKMIRSLYDILNLRSLWRGEELNPWGTLDANELEEAIAGHVGLPGFVFDFLDAHEKTEDRLHHFPSLLATFFKQQQPTGFLKEYLTFEREWRLVLTAFRAKKWGRDLSVEFQYEDPEEELIAQMLAQKDAKTFEPPEKYQELKHLFEKYGDDPLGLEKALSEYRFNKIQSLVEMNDFFSSDAILAYMTQYIIVQEWFDLDSKQGLKIIDNIVKEIS